MHYIFIGGVGRSGTTVTNNFLQRHQDACGFPMETKFIVEVDGLCDLVDAFSTSFSITHRNVTLARFWQFMERIVRFDPALADSIRAKHYGKVRKALPEFFPNYEQALKKLLNTVVRESYYSDRSIVIGHAREFVEALFSGVAAGKGGKRFVCEKTPSNLMRIEFLFELFPTAGFVHCIRDPRAVLFSLSKQGWIPDLEFGAKQIAGVLDRWQSIKPRIDLAHRRYVEVRMEDLVKNTSATLERIAALLDMPPYEQKRLNGAEAHVDLYWGTDRKSTDLTPRFEEWRTKLSEADRMRITEILAPNIEALGYPL